MHGAHSIYLARTYAYVAAGKKGLVILDIENPEKMKIDQTFDADGCITTVTMSNSASLTRANSPTSRDGKNGLRVVQLTSPETSGQLGLQPAAASRSCGDLQAGAWRPRVVRGSSFWTATEPSTRAVTRSVSRDESVARPLNR